MVDIAKTASLTYVMTHNNIFTFSLLEFYAVYTGRNIINISHVVAGHSEHCVAWPIHLYPTHTNRVVQGSPPEEISCVSNL